jgi:heme ABC exporter ATP-binding subunit CcmA
VDTPERAPDVNVVVQAKALSRRYGRFWALRDLDLTLHAGEAVALLGANGAGKSTLLSLLATLSRASSGKLQMLGVDPAKKASVVRAELGYVAHHTLLDDALTARENLDYYANLFGISNTAERVQRRLDGMGLADRAEDRVEGFSRGMRQRLSLARALLHDPRFLVLDEPFTGLDAPGCRDLAQQLAAEKEKGTALILATHQLEQVLPWCDRVVVLNVGRKVEESPASLYDAPGWAAHLTEIAAAGGLREATRR